MKNLTVTIKDVANLANVSTATVSLALSGDSRVNIKTKKLVEEAANKLNYIPNEIGRSLRAKKTETISFIIPNTSHHVFTHPYFAQLLEGINEVLDNHNYNLLLSTSPSEKDESAAYNKILKNRRADGIILSSASINDLNILRLVESGFPVVYLGKLRHDNVLTVERDDIGGAYTATEHLIRIGRKRIVHITGPLDHQEGIDRLDGYKKALLDNKIHFDESLIIEKDFSRESGYEAAAELMRNHIEYDALFAGNDLMAIGALKFYKENKISVPGDVSVVGFDDIEMSTVVSPMLTTIHQPMREIGYAAAEKLISFLNNQEVQEKRTIMSTHLVIRESCGAERL
ncbi:LacI family DNA-binding transcriptional regulator [Paenibacillus qinlingensis]|uniref:DNA-binding LacI/PurR family transcriptional regulator n=1 Tax=Paenibacillus qinlingensis TaxID=1837343 RepID=A0ABU1NU01_9BACL|nr:LacI family DNA-binding transcriptional regulator [Paenibacillus qinlingensis]MDR6550960.1 DNA-binding LacI/PurR family transcriptional regulator [Paenibacillus qinlingensis]